MRRFPLRVGLVCLASALGASAAAEELEVPDVSAFGESRWELGAALQLEWGYGTESGKSQKLGTTFDLDVGVRLPLGLELKAIGRLASDAFDQLEPGDPNLRTYSRPTRPGNLGDRTEGELREFYLDAALGPAFLRLGKQQIVWGEADGLKVLDVVNPQSFIEFILPAFDESRVPLWAANLELPLGSSVLQLLWIPDPTVHRIPGLDEVESDDLYAPTAPMFRPDAPIVFSGPVVVDLQEVEDRKWEISDSDLGARIETVFAGWDLSLNYLYQFDDNPVLARGLVEILFGPTGLQATVEITPSYERRVLAGATFSRAFGDLTLRGETAYSFDRSYSTVAFAETTGIVESDEIAYVVGLDWYGFRDSLISAQFFQTVILEHQPGMFRDERETTATFFLRRQFLHDRLRLQTMWLHGFDHADGLVRPKLSYELRDYLRVWLGADVFYGDENGPFGQYDENDRVILGLEWAI